MRTFPRHSPVPGGSRALLRLLVLLTAPASLAGQTPATLTPDQQIMHVLNRLGYGPRAGDFARVRAMGVQAYIEAQLNPERLADSLVEAKLAVINPTRGWSLEALLNDDRPAAGIAVQRRDPLILREQSAERARAQGAPPSSDPDSALYLRRALHNATVPPVLTRANRRYADESAPLDSRIVRAVYSERQLLEAMVDFWFNHFNINFRDPYLIAHWTDQVLRPNALGKFEDLLVATATHPAMMLYLDNWLSAAPVEVVTARLVAWRPPAGENREIAVRRRADFFSKTKGLNENYARELMELHTLGVDGGYTQKDVQQVARALTGWTISGPREDGTFLYEPLIHEEGDKVVLGRTIKSGGMAEGREILRMLAQHPSTARFISFKLARRFVADDPPASVVEAAAKTFQATGGDLRAVMRTIVTSPEFMDPKYYQVKVKKPIDMVVSSLRAVGAELDLQLFTPIASLNRPLTDMGEPLGRHEAPDGYPEVASAWVSTNALYQRMSFALSLTSRQLRGISPNLESADRLFRELGYGEPTPEQIADARSLLARRAALGAGGAAAMMMATEDQSDPMSKRMQARRTTEEPPGPVELRAIATAVHLGSPQFQKR